MENVENQINTIKVELSDIEEGYKSMYGQDIII